MAYELLLGVLSYLLIGGFVYLYRFKEIVRSTRDQELPFIADRSTSDVYLDPRLPLWFLVGMMFLEGALVWPVGLFLTIAHSGRLVPPYIRMVQHVRNGGRLPGTVKKIPPGFL